MMTGGSPVPTLSVIAHRFGFEGGPESGYLSSYTVEGGPEFPSVWSSTVAMQIDPNGDSSVALTASVGGEVGWGGGGEGRLGRI